MSWIGRLKAGVAEAAATQVKDRPEGGILRLVDPNKKELESAHDEFYAQALVLDDNQQRPAIITIDVGSLDGPRLVPTISQKTGLPNENIAINWSHTHGSSEVDGRSKAPGSEESLAHTLSDLVQCELADLKPAALRTG